MIFEVLILALAISLAAWYLNLLASRRNSNEPPGPIPLPILGNLLTIARASLIPHEALGILAKKYGEVYKLQAGTVPTVVLSSVEAVKKIFNSEDGSGRDCRGMFFDRGLKQGWGIAMANGYKFKTTRGWTVKALKERGFGRSNIIEQCTHDEAQRFVDKIAVAVKNNDGIFEPSLQFSIHALNVSWVLLTGSRKEEDDKQIIHLVNASEDFTRAGVFGAGILVAYPFLRYVFPGITGYNIQMKSTQDIFDLAMEVLDEFRQLGNYKNDPSNFVESYLQEMDENKGKPDNVFTEDNFKLIFADIFQGSIETTAAFIEALVLHVAINVNVQKKIHEEIDEVIGEETVFGMNHFKRMTFTQAAIMEAHRHARVLPQFLPHMALTDITYKNFLIKKGTVILPATESINYNEAVFSHPKEFRPEHFIDDNGSLKNMDKILPFGIGPRQCPGQSVAEVIVFIFLATILRSYTVTTIPNEPTPRTDLQLGFTMRPYPYNVIFKPREK